MNGWQISVAFGVGESFEVHAFAFRQSESSLTQGGAIGDLKGGLESDSFSHFIKNSGIVDQRSILLAVCLFLKVFP